MFSLNPVTDLAVLILGIMHHRMDGYKFSAEIEQGYGRFTTPVEAP
jgi:hypothetical protein